MNSNLAMKQIIEWAENNHIEILEIAKGMGLEESYLKQHEDIAKNI